MRRPILLLAFLLLAVPGAMAAKSILIELPPVRADNRPDQFDAERAAGRLAFILGDQRPHPADTPANGLVRGKILMLLQSMGMKPVVRDQIACNELFKQRGVSCARVRNIIAVLGPPTGRGVLLNAHYDSTPVGPGAGDDGIGVATLLEVGSILRTKKLNRPVILLFNEGEELGLVGARAFLADPLSRNVDSLVNLEARGVRGPVNMFETSVPNAAAIATFSRAAVHPAANSLSTDIYRLLPNYTDVNSFAGRDWLTLNLAPMGNETRYHSAGDDLAALDHRTLQHMGDQTLALASTLASGPRPQAGGDRIFMDVAGRTLIVLPMSVGLVLLAGLLITFVWIAWKRGGLVRGAIVVGGTIVGSTVLSWLALTLIGAVRQGMFWRAEPLWTHLAVYASVVLAAVALLRTIGRSLEVRQLRMVFWLAFLIVGAGIAVIARGAIIDFLFPPLFLLVGILAERSWRGAERVGALAAVIAVYLTWGATLALLEELMNGGPMVLFAILGSFVILPALIEAKAVMDGVQPRLAMALAAGPALLAWAAAATAPAYSADRQQRFVIEHVTDLTDRKAWWAVVNDGKPLPHSYSAAGQWTRGKLPYSDRPRWITPGPPLALVAPPSAEPVAQPAVVKGSGRTIGVTFHANGADSIGLIGPKDADIRAAGVQGFVRPLDPTAKPQKYYITCFGRSCDGLTLQIVTASKKPIEFTLIAARSGLPANAARLIAARPRNARPQYLPDETLTLSKIRL